MELYNEIFGNILKGKKAKITFFDCNESVDELVDSECYKVLEKIKAVINNDSLNDSECFMRIAQIINIFEQAGIDCGHRHDFG